MMDKDELFHKLRDTRTLINDGYNQKGTYLSGARCKFCVDTIDNALVMLKEQEEIVLCKDCKWRNTGACFCKAPKDVRDDWFCSEGERKEGR